MICNKHKPLLASASVMYISSSKFKFEIKIHDGHMPVAYFLRNMYKLNPTIFKVGLILFKSIRCFNTQVTKGGS